MKNTTIIIIGIFFFQAVDSQNLTSELIDKQITETDKYRLENKEKTEVYVKTENEGKLIEVDNQNWPKYIETTYNIVKDSANRIVLIGIYPYSKSSDWNIEFLHYFNAQGKTIATIKNTRFFNNGLCIDGVLIEVSKTYYSSDMKIINSDISLTDKEGNDLSGENCINQYQMDFDVKKNVKEQLTYINYPVNAEL